MGLSGADRSGAPAKTSAAGGAGESRVPDVPRPGRWAVASSLLVLAVLAVGAWFLSGCAPPPPPCSANWVGPVGGSYAEPTSWDTGAVPGPAAVACAPAGSSIVVQDAQAVASVQFAGDLAIAPGGSLALTGAASSVDRLELQGELAGTAQLTVATLNWTAGSMHGAGTTVVTAPSDISGSVELGSGRVLQVLGDGAVRASLVRVCDDARLSVVGATSVTGLGTEISTSGCANATGGRLDVVSTGRLTLATATTIGLPVDNAGTVRVLGPTTADLTSSFTQTTGTVDLADPASVLRVDGGAGTLEPAGGTIAGSGTLAATLRGAPTIAPGAPGGIGALTISGDLLPTTGARLALDVAGTAPGVSFDQLTVGGQAAVTGLTAAVTYATGYTAPSGTPFAVLQATGALSGTLAAVEVAPIGTTGLRPTYAPSVLTLTVNSCVAPVFGPRANLMERSMSTLDVSGCDLTGADLDLVSASGANFSDTVLRNASFNGAFLRDVNFTNADLTGALMNATYLTGAVWSNTVCPDATRSTDNAGTCEGHTAGPELVVNALGDAPDQVPGDGVCETAVPGQCTLRAAVLEANASPAVNRVTFASDGTYALTTVGSDEDAAQTGDLDLTASLTIDGTGRSVVIDGSAVERLLEVRPGSSLALLAVQTVGGIQVDGNAYLAAGRFGGSGAGVVNTGNLMLNSEISGVSGAQSVTSSGNTVSRSSTLGGDGVSSTGALVIRGGSVQGSAIAVDSSGPTTISSVTISGAVVGVRAGATTTVASATVTASDTAVQASATLTLSSSTITGGRVGVDSASHLTVSASKINNSSEVGIRSTGDASISTSTLDGNGRGIDATGPVTLTGSTVSNSSATAPGPMGGVVLAGAGATSSITRSTISANRASGLDVVAGTVALLDTTIAGNGTSAVEGSATAGVTAVNSILAGGSGPSCSGPVGSGGWNLSTDASCGLADPTDLVDTPARLAPLAANGGVTRTQAPLAHSAAIDSGRPGCTGVDQRLLARPKDGDGDAVAACDRGAVEAPNYVALDLVVTSTLDSPDKVVGDGLCATSSGTCTLRAAVQESNALFGDDTVTLPAAASFVLGSQGPLEIKGALALHGRGSSITGPGYLKVTAVATEVAVDGLTLTTVEVLEPTASLVLRDVRATVVRNSGHLSGVHLFVPGQATGVDNQGTLELVDSTIASTTTAALVNASGAVARLTGSTLLGGGGTTLVNAGVIITSDSIVTNQVGAPVCSGIAPVSEGWNLWSDATCGPGGATDLVGIPARVHPVLVNGVLQSVLPDTGSPAVDSGRPGCSGTDQRGAPRPIDGDGDGAPACDRGAVELDDYHELHLVVDETADGLDAQVGDGTCATAAGRCTVRAAVQEANAFNGSDTISLSPGADYRFTNAFGYLDVWTPLTFDGPGAVIGADNHLRVFTSTAFEAADVTLSGGFELGLADARFRNIRMDQLAIWSRGTLEIDHATPRYPDPAGPSSFSPWISSSGRAALVAVAAPTAGVNLVNSGSMTVQGSRIRRVTNTGHLEVTASTFDPAPSPDQSVATIGLNQSAAGSSATITGSSVNGYEHGLQVEAGTVVVDTSTFVDASVDAIAVTGGSVSVANSVLSTRGSAPVCRGPVASAGWNVVSDLSCGLGGPNDLNGVNPSLAPLDDRGGPGPAALPILGSPAMDTGRPDCSGLDVTGHDRVVDGDGDGAAACDRGATETGPRSDLALVVNSTVDAVDAAPGDGRCETATLGECTLRAAVMEANRTNGTDTITLQPAAEYVLTNPSSTEDRSAAGDLDIATPLVVRGSGASVALPGGGDNVLEHFGTGSLAVEHLAIRSARTGLRSAAGPLQLDGITLDSLIDGVYSGGTLDATDLVVNVSGKGISVFGAATVRSSTITRAGPAIEYAASFTLVRSVVIESSSAFVSRPGAPSLSVETSTIYAGSFGLPQGPISLVDSLVWGSSMVGGPDVVATNSIFSSCLAPLRSAGWNAGSWGCGLDQPSDLVGTAMELSPLADHGGPTLTQVPNSSSSVVDSGRPGCSGVDQRGQPRGIDGNGDGIAACDRGPVELGEYRALSMVVNTAVDEPDAVPGDGVCQISTPGLCSLRAALEEGNRTNGPDQISLLPSGTYRLSGTRPIPAIEAAFDLVGNGATIEMGEASALFVGDTSLLTSISDVRITTVPGGGVQSQPLIRLGALTMSRVAYVANVGGIQASTLHLSDSVVSDNTGWVPVIAAGPTSTIERVTIQRNSSGIVVYGGGTAATIADCIIEDNGGNVVDNRGVTSIVRTHLRRNSGSILNGGSGFDLASLTIADSTISGMPWYVVWNSGDLSVVRSTVDDNGGGIFNQRTLNVVDSTVSRTRLAAGVTTRRWGVPLSGDGTTIRTSTFSGNEVGAIEVITSGSTWVYDSTITSNSGFGASVELGSIMAVQNSIIADQLSGPNCIGAGYFDGGYNLVSDASCPFSAATDLRNTHANLGGLADNGGPTLTHLPAVGSAAVDSGRSGCTTPDQRGVARPRGARCDRGSVER